MVWDKMGCIVISNLVISLVPYSLYWRESTVRAYYHVLVKQFNDLLWRGGANYVLFPLKSDTLLAVLLCFVDIIALQNSAWPCRQFWGATMTVNIDTISMRRTWPARFRECITPLIKHGISLLFLLPLYWTSVSYLFAYEWMLVNTPDLLSICTGILRIFDILQFEIFSLMNWVFFLVWKQTGYFYQFKLNFFQVSGLG